MYIEEFKHLLINLVYKSYVWSAVIGERLVEAKLTCICIHIPGK